MALDCSNQVSCGPPPRANGPNLQIPAANCFCALRVLCVCFACALLLLCFLLCCCFACLLLCFYFAFALLLLSFCVVLRCFALLLLLLRFCFCFAFAKRGLQKQGDLNQAVEQHQRCRLFFHNIGNLNGAFAPSFKYTDVMGKMF